MVSIKTIKLNEQDKIIFRFLEFSILITISLNEQITELSCDLDDFNDKLNELKMNLIINLHKYKQIRYWFNKNYKKINSYQEYITRYGRKTVIKTN